MRWIVVLGLVLLLSSRVHAEELPLTLLDASGVRVDGSLGDWRGLRMRGLGSGGTGVSGSMKYVLGYDDAALYLAAQVLDDSLIRTPSPGRGEDAVVITLVIPTDSGTRVVELWLFPGVVGEQGAAGLMGTPGGGLGPIADVRVVEGPLEGGQRGAGYVLEARVPWASIPGGDQWVGAGGSITLHDVDRGGRSDDVSSARFDPAHPENLPRLAPSGIAAATLESYMASRGLSTTPRFDLRGDVAGDRRHERVAVVDTTVVVLGPGFRNGQSYSFAPLSVVRSSDVVSAELKDVTGDNKAELLVTLRQQNDLGARDVLQVFDFVTDQPRRIFALDVRKQVREGEVNVTLQVKPGKRNKPPTIEVKVGAARGVNASNFRIADEAGTEPLLLPWGEVSERVYQWDGSRFVVASQEENANHVATPSASTHVASAFVAPEEPAAPPGIDDLIDAFRKAQRIDRRLEPRLKRNANVAEDERAEQLMLFDKSLLVIGPGYRNGLGYFFYELPVNNAEDIQRVFAADVTGDGRAEIFVRVRQWIGDVKRELLYVHQLEGNELRQLLVTEVRRAQGDNAVGNIVRLRWQGPRATLVIYPGHAQGWSQTNYPYVTDTSDGTDALLLPWTDSMVTYRFESGRLSR